MARLQQALRENPERALAIQEWPIYGWSGWTMEQVQASLDSVDRGNLRYGEAGMLMLAKHPVWFHGYKTRTQTLVATPFRLEAPEGLDPFKFQELQYHLPAMWGADSAGAHGLAMTGKYRVALGVAPASVYWSLSPTGRTWLPVMNAKEAGWLNYFPAEQRYRFQARDGQHVVIPDGREWLLFREMSSLYPHTEGLYRPTAVVTWFEQAVIRYWYQYCRTHGNAQKKVKVPGKQRETKDFEELVNLVKTMVGGTTVPCPTYPDGSAFDLELVEAKYSTFETFPQFIDYVDRWITLCWLGAIDNTQGAAAGSRARAQVHERVSLRYLAADCEVSAAALRILLRQWCVYNRIDPRLAPVPVFEWQPEPDRKAEAETRKTNAEAAVKAVEAAEGLERHGVAVDWPELAELHQIPYVPGKKPELLTAGGESSESKLGGQEVSEGAAG